MVVLVLAAQLGSFLISPSARAQTEVQQGQATAPATQTQSEPVAQEPASSEPTPLPTQKPTQKNPKGRRGGDRKETEGTTAPNRFETDTVIKSQYRLDGQPLEVDPD